MKSWGKEDRDYDEYYLMHAKLKMDYSKSIEIKKDGKPLMLTPCLAYYADFIADVGVPGHKQKSNTERYIKSQISNLKLLKEALTNEGIDPGYLSVTEINDHHVGIVHDFLLSRYANKTYNHKMATYKAFLRFLISKDYPIKNVFEEVVARPTVARTSIISIKEFDELCETVSPISGISFESQIRNGKPRKFQRNLYRPYLIPAWKFALFSGCRKGEIQEVRVQDIGEDHISCVDQKASKKKKDRVVRLIWLNEELQTLVNEIKQGLNPEDYLIAPQEENRNNMMHIVSRAFSHFWSKISERELTFHDLRNTYATEMIRNYGAATAEILGGLHSELSVTKQHYLNKEEILKSKRGSSLFGSD